jgi:uncharacterized membrane protein
VELNLLEFSLLVAGTSLLQLGLLVLIATPVARVPFALGAFALQRDRTYVIVTLVVLSILAYGLVTGEP